MAGNDHVDMATSGADRTADRLSAVPGIRRAPSPKTPVAGLYLASAWAGFGGYTGVVQSAGACADMILKER